MPTAVDTTRILVIEDSPRLLALLEQILGEQGWIVRSATDGESGLVQALEQQPDLAIIDIGLPRRNGFEVTAELRRRGMQSPVLMLTARNAVSDRVRGLDAGADDYLAKPFDSPELLARVRALLRRGGPRGTPARVRVGDLLLEPLTRELLHGEQRLALTQRECALLELFMRNVGRPLTRQAIAAHVWKTSDVDLDETNIVDVYVAYVRKKLDAIGATARLQTVRGVGYVFRVEPVSLTSG